MFLFVIYLQFVKISVQATKPEETDNNLANSSEGNFVVRQSARINFDDDCNEEDGLRENTEIMQDYPQHLQIGKEFTFRVVVVSAVGIDQNFSDVFIQFK